MRARPPGQKAEAGSTAEQLDCGAGGDLGRHGGRVESGLLVEVRRRVDPEFWEEGERREEANEGSERIKRRRC